VVGLKPTYGAVSRYGLIAMASSLDQIGPFAMTVLDAAIVFEAIAGYDEMDATSHPAARYRGLYEEIQHSTFKIQNVRVGVPKEYFAKGIDGSVERAVQNAIRTLEGAGAKVVAISLPHTPYALPCYYIIQPAEVSANLARYDGIRYGHAQKAATDLQDFYFKTRGEGFGAEVKRRILLGTYVLSAGYYDAYYAKAQKVRRLVRNDFLEAFKKVDVIVAPTSPTLPFKIGERIDDPVSMYLADIYTVAVNLAGLPALSMPCGWANPDAKQTDEPPVSESSYAKRDAGNRGCLAQSGGSGGSLPIGLQIIGKHFDERTILLVGDLLERIGIAK
jgi:aspartyl-tRNA(Asn)/glutamyl-tRNA(Gln) amidotransferase subunit A